MAVDDDDVGGVVSYTPSVLPTPPSEGVSWLPQSIPEVPSYQYQTAHKYYPPPPVPVNYVQPYFTNNPTPPPLPENATVGGENPYQTEQSSTEYASNLTTFTPRSRGVRWGGEERALQELEGTQPHGMIWSAPPQPRITPGMWPNDRYAPLYWGGERRAFQELGYDFSTLFMPPGNRATTTNTSGYSTPTYRYPTYTSGGGGGSSYKPPAPQYWLDMLNWRI